VELTALEAEAGKLVLALALQLLQGPIYLDLAPEVEALESCLALAVDLSGRGECCLKLWARAIKLVDPQSNHSFLKLVLSVFARVCSDKGWG